jgi:CHAD domain-containing protein
LPVETKQLAENRLGLAAALANYCSAQAALVADALRRRAHVHRGVHEARKGIRRLRSVVALGFPRRAGAVAKTDAALRRLGRSLSRVRDAQVALDCVRSLAHSATNRGQRALWQRITTRLVAVRRRTMRQARARDPEFRRRQAAIARIGKSLRLLPWPDIEPAELRARLKHTRNRVGRAADLFLYEPKLLHLHRLRRRLRRYRMQITALATILDSPVPVRDSAKIKPIVRGHTQAHGRVSHRVDQLGALLDIHLLRTAIRRLPASPDRTQGLALLRKTS